MTNDKEELRTKEKNFEESIESFFISQEGGYKKGSDTFDVNFGIYKNTLLTFVKETQPKEWKRFETQNPGNTDDAFCKKFNDAVIADGMLSVLRHGFKHRGIHFRVCYFRPESSLNQLSAELYEKNVIECYRQWYYSATCSKSVDMVLVVNGIPLIALELKNQLTGQSVTNAKLQWQNDRDPREIVFQFNNRVFVYFCVDLYDVYMTTKLNGKATFFLPFNQGSNGAGKDGGRGNPSRTDKDYITSYLWESVLQKDSMMDILQKFIHLQVVEEKKYTDDGEVELIEKQTLIFPRYHQLDVVRKLIEDVKENGSGKNYLVQHSAGSGKSNSISWTAYRLASLHDEENNAIFSSVVVVTDRTVLDSQLQATISSFDHTLGSVTTIDDKKNSQDLKDALNNGDRIIVTTLQKFPVIYEEVDKVKGRNFAVIVDEAHSSQTGSAALKLKTALADTEDALKEYAEIEGKAEEEIEKDDKLLKEMIAHGKHKNLSFFAFTATPKDKTLEMFGTRYDDGSFHPFHIYSMRQAIEEGFILDVLKNYMTYDTCYKIAKNFPDNPDLPSNKATKVILKYAQLHPTNISQKAEIIIETFMNTTRNKINHRGKMMVVTASRLAAVRYFHELKRLIKLKGYQDAMDILVAFSGAVKDGDVEYTEPNLNVRKDDTHISENQTKEEFHNNFNVLIVAEKYQTGFDEPLLHTMIVDKKLRGIKAVQTLSRLNRTCSGKDDTFILDFVNTAEDIHDAFQPFYQETYLAEEVNADLLYSTQKTIRGYAIYGDKDVENFVSTYKTLSNKDKNALGKLSVALKPFADSYNLKTSNEKYNFRRELRKLVRYYDFVSQVTRMFDEDLHKEYIFCKYLVKLIPAESEDMIDIENLLNLEYYKLKETFKGDISLQKDSKGVYEPAEESSSGSKNKKSPLDEIIDKINEKYKGNFTEGDRVVISALQNKLVHNEKLIDIAKTSNSQIFMQGVFPGEFNKAAMECYSESEEAYKGLFADKAKYEAIMSALADILYRQFTSKNFNSFVVDAAAGRGKRRYFGEQIGSTKRLTPGNPQINTLDDLYNVLRKCWAKETAYPNCQNEWVSTDPSFGQCAITAMIVYDLFGGTIHRIRVNGGGTHYFNKINGQYVDLTREQFDLYNIPVSYESNEQMDRQYCGKNGDTKKRYELLLDNIRNYLSSTI
ncbi:MAG: DEAD/DEAH box helicase family protein [Treponema sp.]|nr:DEAD/DEAH box helicase family protein [Treponema sp.]